MIALPPPPPPLPPPPSLTVLSGDAASYITVGAVGSCSPAVSQPVITYPLPATGSSFESVLKAPPSSSASPPNSSGGSGGALAQGQIVSWRAAEGGSGGPLPPADWRGLAKAGLKAIYGVTIRGGPKDQLLGMLNVGFLDPSDQELKVKGRDLGGDGRTKTQAGCFLVVAPPALFVPGWA
jgi:hypothetical protein